MFNLCNRFLLLMSSVSYFVRNHLFSWMDYGTNNNTEYSCWIIPYNVLEDFHLNSRRFKIMLNVADMNSWQNLTCSRVLLSFGAAGQMKCVPGYQNQEIPLLCSVQVLAIPDPSTVVSMAHCLPWQILGLLELSARTGAALLFFFFLWLSGGAYVPRDVY